MTNYTMKLLKCPACGGPMDTLSGESSMKCPYCGNAVIIPESLRKANTDKQQPQESLFSSVNTNSMVGLGSQWAEVVRLAKSGKKDEAIKLYLSFASVSESDAKYTVDALAGAQTYKFAPGTGYTAVQLDPVMASYANTAKSVTRWSMWLSCGITAFVMIIVLITLLPVLIGVAASLWAAFNSF